MNKNRVKLRIFGENLLVRIFQPEKVVALGGSLLLAKFNDNPSLLIDPFFYHSFSCQDIKNINDISRHLLSGSIVNSKSVLEIWKGRRLVEKLKLDSIINYSTLFPLYSFEIIEQTEPASSIIFKQKEIGNTGNFLILDDQFDINLLKFRFLYFKNITVLANINYDDRFLKSQNSDTLITHQSVQNKNIDIYFL